MAEVRAPLTPRQKYDIAEAIYHGEKAADVAKRYGISKSYVYDIMRFYGLGAEGSRPNWTEEEDEILREHYPAHGAKWGGWKKLMPERKPTEQSIQSRAKRLGLHVARG